jgi:SAM-dependent methyltransferase
MALTCPIGFDTDRLRHHVREAYERVARDPSGDFHFHRGALYAVRALGYDVDELWTLPELATDRFAGVGNPHTAGPIHPGETVLDHACGAGTDLLLAARKVGPRGKAIGVDMTAGMRDCARRAARMAGLASIVDVRGGVFEELPVESGTVDVVLSNGVLNLAPDKPRVLAEAARVLAPGGRLHLADVVVARELKEDARSNPDLWAACIGGALTVPELLDATRAAGFADVRTVQWFDAFAGTSAEAKVSSDLHVRAISLFAQKA